MKSITHEQLELYFRKESMKYIAKATGVNQFTLRRRFVEAGLPIKKSKRPADMEELTSYKHLDEVNDMLCNVEDTSDIMSQEYIDTAIDELEYDAEVALKNTQAHYEDIRNQFNIVNLKNEKTIVKLRAQLAHQKKMVREVAKHELDTDAIINMLDKIVGSIHIPEARQYSALFDSSIPEYGLVAVLSDIHFGEVVDKNEVPSNEYNYKVIRQRLTDYAYAIVTNKEQSKVLVVTDLKDILKGVIHGGLQETEGSLVTSIIEAVESYMEFIQILIPHYYRIEIYSTGSNHDRLTDYIVHKHKYLDYGRLIDSILTKILDAKYAEGRIEIFTTDSGYHLLNINTANIMLMHGDTLRGYNPTSSTARSSLQDICISMFNTTYRHAISGHTHSGIVALNQYKGMNIVNGSMVGDSEYGVQNGFSSIQPSQTILFVEQNGSIESVRQVLL